MPQLLSIEEISMYLLAVLWPGKGTLCGLGLYVLIVAHCKGGNGGGAMQATSRSLDKEGETGNNRRAKALASRLTEGEKKTTHTMGNIQNTKSLLW
jgi:hypothetical protein